MVCVVISGPTGSGKSGLAERLAVRYNGCIINADSQQVLEELPILTDQPSLGGTFLYGHKKHTEYYSSFQWCLEAAEVVYKVLGQGKVPIIVGGTGLYLNNFLNGHLDKDMSDVVFFISGLPVFKLLLNPSKKELEARCWGRILGMFPRVTQEVRACPDHPRLRRVIGFSEVMDGVDVGEIQEKMLIRTRQYVKRQKTWFNKYCVDWNQYESLEQVDLGALDQFVSAQ